MRPSPKLAAALAALCLTLPGCGKSAREAPVLEEAFGVEIPVFHQVPAFELVGDDGKPFTREGLKGKVWVASFIFTSCPDVCPAMVSKIQVLQRVLPEGAVLVSISVDPENDTPKKLRGYASFNHRIPGKWLLATGEWERISELAEKGFFLAGKEKLLHSPRFGLVDRLGRLRGYYDSREEAQMTKLIRDVSLVLAEDPSKPAPGKS